MCFVSINQYNSVDFGRSLPVYTTEYLSQSVNQVSETNTYILVQCLGIVMHFFPKDEIADVSLDDYHYC